MPYEFWIDNDIFLLHRKGSRVTHRQVSNIKGQGYKYTLEQTELDVAKNELKVHKSHNWRHNVWHQNLHTDIMNILYTIFFVVNSKWEKL